MLTRAQTRKLIVFSAVAIAAVPLQMLPAAAAAPPDPRIVSAAVPGRGPVEVGGRFDLAGVSFDGPAGAEVELRASDDGRNWTGWTDVGDGSAEGPDRQSDEYDSARRTTQPVWTGAARFVQVRSSDGPVRNVVVHGVDVKGHGESTMARIVRGLKGVFRTDPTPHTAAMTDQPSIVTRAQWGADESIRRDDPSYGKVQFAVLHHTVNANDYSAAEAPALVRGIYTYHVKTNGWDDIGYNFLVDRFGTIYEGRYGGIDKPVIGAHAEGFNTYSTGVSMLGTFTSLSPPAATVAAVQELMAWRLDVAHVDPTGKATVVSKGSGKYAAGASVTVDGIIGHRDIGTTSCPGDLGYGKLASIRSAVATMGLPKIYAPAVSPASIEGRQKTSYESTTITARASEPLTWTVTVTGARAGLVRTFAGAGPSLSFTWNGTDDAGANVPAGAYTVTFAGVGPSGEARAASLSVQVVDLDLLKPVVRVAGADRYATAAAAAGQTAPTSATDVVVTSGDTSHLVDSLVAGPLTKAKSAPLLLTSRDSLPAATAGELDRLKPKTAWVVGGTAAVGDGVETALEQRGITVKRLAGVDAPGTAAAVSSEVGGGGGGAVVVARESSHLVDGLAAAGPAAALRRPVLLVSRDSVPSSTREALASLGVSGASIWAVGGAAAISDAVVSDLGATRVAGADRWATAVAVADAGKGAGVIVDTVIVASGETTNLVDALAGGSFAEAVVLTGRSSLPAATGSWLTGNRAAVKKAFVLGGTAAVGDAPLESVRDAINQP